MRAGRGTNSARAPRRAARRRRRVALLLALVLSGAGCDEPAPSASRAAGTAPDAPPDAAALAAAIAGASISSPDVTLQGAPRTARVPVEAPPYSRRQGNVIGIPTLGLISPDEFSPPFINGRGIGAGDYDRDGFADVVVATERGIELYRNDSGVMFVPQPVDVPAVAELDVFTVAFADLDDDGWLDIFLSSYMKGNHVILSDRGRFHADGLIAVPDPPGVLSTSLAFGDVDEDGDLDVFAGNWYYGALHQIPPEDATNQLLVNRLDEGEGFVSRPMEGAILGETLAVLLSDFDMDGHLDLVVGNDFGPPDVYYLGDGRGGFRMIHRTEEIIPETTESTMSIDTADYDNDGDLDIYLAQIAEGVPNHLAANADYQKRVKAAYCDELNNSDEKARCQEGVTHHNLFAMGYDHRAEHIERCGRIDDAVRRAECENEMNLLTAIMSGRRDLCEKIPDAAQLVKRRCIAYFKPGVPGTDEQYLEAIPQIREQNVLLRSNGRGRFENVAERVGVGVTGWSWNALFFDADNDEWQDIYVVNGTWLARVQSTQKFFFRNVEGRRFDELTDDFGLQSFMVQSAYVTIDMENDGDLDLLVNGIHGPFWYYRNNEARGSSLLVELRDHVGNRSCVGCKLWIEYGDGGGEAGARSQLREIKLGGGYHSFNPSQAHFGLGGHGEVTAIVVRWSTGGETRIEGPLPANALYTITRGAAPDDSVPVSPARARAG